jgi:hypothetical protein
MRAPRVAKRTDAEHALKGLVELLRRQPLHQVALHGLNLARSRTCEPQSVHAQQGRERRPHLLSLIDGRRLLLLLHNKDACQRMSRAAGMVAAAAIP